MPTLLTMLFNSQCLPHDDSLGDIRRSPRRVPISAERASERLVEGIYIYLCL